MLTYFIFCKLYICIYVNKVSSFLFFKKAYFGEKFILIFCSLYGTVFSIIEIITSNEKLIKPIKTKFASGKISEIFYSTYFRIIYYDCSSHCAGSAI